MISNGAFEYRVDLRLLVITKPTLPIDLMIESAVDIYATAGILVNVRSSRELARPELSRPSIGRCAIGYITTEQKELFELRGEAQPEEIIIYFVDQTIPPSLGCSVYPPGSPGLIVTRGANRWTLAHELGHVLGLSHVDDNARLMTCGGTDKFRLQVPVLSEGEKAMLRYSKLVRGKLLFEPGRPAATVKHCG